jgi:phosphoglycolate phosphatase
MSLNPPADGAIFDFDGVIIDSLPPVVTAINGALTANGYPPRTAAELARFIGPPTPTAFIELTGAAEGSELLAACVSSYHEHFARVYLDQTRLIDGMAELLQGLALPLALATAKERKFVGPLLEHFGLESAFEAVCAPELSEPKAETVASAKRALGVSEPVMVGDRIYDIEAARACGLRVIAVTWGIGDRAELSSADVLVEQPAELRALLS